MRVRTANYFLTTRWRKSLITQSSLVQITESSISLSVRRRSRVTSDSIWRSVQKTAPSLEGRIEKICQENDGNISSPNLWELVICNPHHRNRKCWMTTSTTTHVPIERFSWILKGRLCSPVRRHLFSARTEAPSLALQSEKTMNQLQ